MRNLKSIRRSGLATAQDRHEQRALTDSYLKIVAALPRRPEPRAHWDGRARGDGRVPHPAIDGVVACRAAVRAAIETGDAAIVRATRLAVEAYFDGCMAAALDVGAPLTECVTVADVVSEECEAIQALSVARETGSPGAKDLACERLRRANDRAEMYVLATERERRRPLNAVGL